VAVASQPVAEAKGEAGTPLEAEKMSRAEAGAATPLLRAAEG